MKERLENFDNEEFLPPIDGFHLELDDLNNDFNFGEDTHSWQETTVDLKGVKKSSKRNNTERKGGWQIKGVWVSKLAATSLVVILWSIGMWLFYTTRVVQIPNWACFLAVNAVVCILMAFRISKLKDNIVGPEYYIGLIQSISFILIGFSLTDLFFETYYFAFVFRVPDIFSALAVNISIILVVMILNCVALIKFGNRPSEEKFFWTHQPKIIAIMCSIFLGAVIAMRVSLNNIIDTDLFPTGMYGLLSDSLFKAFLFPLYPGQYGGAESFLQIWEILFYNSYAGAMLGLMVIGTFANIFFINQNKAPAIQSAAMMTVVGIPLIIIVMMFLGAIPPPSTLVRLFGAPQLASFVYAIAMISVYIIFLCIMMVFSQAAEVFQPEDD